MARQKAFTGRRQQKASSQGFGGPPAEKPMRADSFDRPQSGRSAYGIAQIRDGLRSLDASSSARAWRQGLSLAGALIGEPETPVRAARILHSSPFSAIGGLRETPVVQYAFASIHSPEGRWTVTVLPRGAERASLPLDTKNQQDVLLNWDELNSLKQWQHKQWRVLKVFVGPLFTSNTLESDLVGELVEDSLQRDGSWADDDDVRMRMVIGVERRQIGGATLILDGEREWRRQVIDEPGGRRRRRLVERRIQPHESIRLRQGRRLVQSTAVSCNCPQSLGVVLSDWRRGLSADQQDAVELSNAAARSGGTNIEGVLSPAGYDDVEAVGRRFKSYEWSRNPFEACKHEHAVRFEIGVPTAEPPDALSLVSDYWTSRTAQMSLDEMVAPLGHDRFTERLSRSLAFDQHWHGLDPLLEAIGAADVVSVTPSELWLPEVVINEMAIPVQPIAGVHVARLMNIQVI